MDEASRRCGVIRGGGAPAERESARAFLVALVADALGIGPTQVNWVDAPPSQDLTYSSTAVVNLHPTLVARGLCDWGRFVPRRPDAPYPIVLGGGIFTTGSHSPESIRGTYAHEASHARDARRTNELLLEWIRRGRPGGDLGFEAWLRRRQGLSAMEVEVGAERRGGGQHATQVRAYLHGFISAFAHTERHRDYERLAPEAQQQEDNADFQQLIGLAREFDTGGPLLMDEAVRELRAYRGRLDDPHRTRLNRFLDRELRAPAHSTTTTSTDFYRRLRAP